MKRALPKNRTANRSAKQRKRARPAADTSPLGTRRARPAAPPPVRPAAPAQRTSSHDKPAVRPSAGYVPRYVPGRLLMQFAPLHTKPPRQRDPATGRLLARAPGGGFDKAAQLRGALFGEHAERLAALGSNHGGDHE